MKGFNNDLFSSHKKMIHLVIVSKKNIEQIND